MASKVCLIDPELRRLCGAFLQLVADHGTFNRSQVLLYVAGRRGGALTEYEERDVIAYVESCGAKRGWEKRADLFHFEPRRRATLLSRKHDKSTIDMFTGKAGA